MAAAIEIDEGVVFKGPPEIDDAILLKDSKGETWKHYLKFGRNYDSYKPEVGQKVRVHYRAWENPTTSKVSYYLNEVEVLGPPPETAPAPSPGPAPAVAYQATHDAAKEPAAQHAEGAAASADTFPAPELGSWASKELSIEGQNRLNVSIKALVANLEQCPEEQKAGRFITPDLILMFVQGLEQGGSEPPPADLPG